MPKIYWIFLLRSTLSVVIFSCLHTDKQQADVKCFFHSSSADSVTREWLSSIFTYTLDYYWLRF